MPTEIGTDWVGKIKRDLVLLIGKASIYQRYLLLAEKLNPFEIGETRLKDLAILDSGDPSVYQPVIELREGDDAFLPVFPQRPDLVRNAAGGIFSVDSVQDPFVVNAGLQRGPDFDDALGRAYQDVVLI